MDAAHGTNWNPYYQRDEDECHRCKRRTTELCPVAERDDGTHFQRTDGSFGESDEFLCEACLTEQFKK